MHMVHASSMLRSSDAYSRSVPVRSAAKKVSVYWDDEERGTIHYRRGYVCWVS